jgi:hypothetical protein
LRLHYQQMPIPLDKLSPRSATLPPPQVAKKLPRTKKNSANLRVNSLTPRLKKTYRNKQLYPQHKKKHPHSFGFYHILCAPGGHDDLLPIRTQLEHPAFAPIHGLGLVGQPGPRATHDRTQCQIPRFSLHHTVYRTVWFVRFPRRVQHQCGTRRVATALQPQPRGRRD